MKALGVLAVLLAPAAIPASIVGQVTDDSGTTPFVQMELRLRSVPPGVEFSSSTGEGGKFSFGGIGPGRYLLALAPLGFRPHVRSIQLVDASDTLDTGLVKLTLANTREPLVVVTDVCDAFEHRATYDWVVAVGIPSGPGIRAETLPSLITADCKTALAVDGIRFLNAIALDYYSPPSRIKDGSIPEFDRMIAEQVEALRQAGRLPRRKLLAVYGYFSAFQGLETRACSPTACVADVFMAPAQIRVHGIEEIF